MSTQPEALRLADALEQQFPLGTAQNFLDGEAAAELRRLHEVEKQRDELLGALKYAVSSGCSTVYAHEYDERGAEGCCGVLSYEPHADDCWVTKAHAAIAKAEEEE